MAVPIPQVYSISFIDCQLQSIGKEVAIWSSNEQHEYLWIVTKDTKSPVINGDPNHATFRVSPYGFMMPLSCCLNGLVWTLPPILNISMVCNIRPLMFLTKLQKNVSDESRGKPFQGAAKGKFVKQEKAAKKIQHWWRVIRVGIRSRRDQFHVDVANEITGRLLDEFLTGEMIPDLFIEVIQASSDRFAPYPEDVLIAKDVLDTITSLVVQELCRACVIDVFDHLVEDYLQQCSLTRSAGIVKMAVNTLIDEECDAVLPGVVREVTSQMVNDYLQLVEDMARLQVLLDPMLMEICDEICGDVLIEQTVSSLITDWSDAMTIDICRTERSRIEQTRLTDRKDTEITTIMRHSSNILDKSILIALLTKIATQDEAATIKMYLDRMVDRLMSQRLLRLHLDLHRQSAQVADNTALASFHYRATANVSVDVLVASLTKQLRSDMSRIK